LSDGRQARSFPNGTQIPARKNVRGRERFLLPGSEESPTIVFVDMEIMRTLASALAKSSACILLSASTVFASDIVLQKVPETVSATSKSNLSPQASFALMNYNVRTQARALYVSSGGDLNAANNMIDDQATTSFVFSPTDNSPVTIIDLGKVSTVRRLSAVYSPRATSIDFYVLQALPGDKSAATSLKLDEKALAKLKAVGTAIDDGTQGRASIDFPATSGRYVMLHWSPAAHSDTAFTVAEVSAFSPSRGNLLASNRNFSNAQTTVDSKDVADSKDVSDNKDVPDVYPPAQPPAEGPPPPLTPPPPFTFIPQLVPASE
jgi:hypothetical protein